MLMALILIGVSSSSGTALCEDKGEGGSCTNLYVKSTAFAANSTSVKFETNLGTVSCTESSFEGETTEEPTESGKSLETRIAVLKFSGCKVGETGCTVTSVKTAYAAPVSWTEGVKGSMTLKSGGSGTPGVSVKCGGIISCTSTGEPVLDVNGGEAKAATVVASKDKLTPGEGSPCPKEISWTATYTFTAPNAGAVFVQNQIANPVRLCKTNGFPFCASASTYPINTPLEAKLETGSAEFTVKINGNPLTTSCTSSTLTGKTTSFDTWPLKGEISALTFTNCGPVCHVLALLLKYEAEIEATNSGNGSGTITMRSGGSGPPRIKVDCGVNYICTYEVKSNTLKTTVPGGVAAPAKLSVNALLDEKVVAGSEAKCGAELEWKGSYKFTKPEDGGTPKMWIIRYGVST
ncbi:MAG: hypothetical protein QOF85_990 [Solirubrobacterales bacterium]|jgi:hypothetical protein|nr:hypothetical protein [Solirubrobacterales bacterium]